MAICKIFVQFREQKWLNFSPKMSVNFTHALIIRIHFKSKMTINDGECLIGIDMEHLMNIKICLWYGICLCQKESLSTEQLDYVQLK